MSSRPVDELATDLRWLARQWHRAPQRRRRLIEAAFRRGLEA